MVGQEALKSTWKLTGFNGNTCNYLGVEPLNGQRRHRIEVYAKNFIAAKSNNVYNEDKTIKETYDELWNKRPTALSLTEDITCTESADDEITYADAKVKNILNVKILVLTVMMKLFFQHLNLIIIS